MTGTEMECGGRRTDDESGGRGVAMVERTRRGVEAMEVAGEENIQKASSEKLRDRISSVAREGWNKIRAKLRGRWLRREGDGLVVEDREAGPGEKVKGMEEMMSELLDAGEGGTVEVEELEGDREDSVSRTSGESRKTKLGFDFVEKLEEDSVDEELERSRRVDKKRKRTEEMSVVRTGMDGIQG
jgi:hypothetical protein